jgi:hypothetical protein
MSSYVTAFDINEHRNTLKMTMGSANLDSLIDSIEEGQCYSFYGSNNDLFLSYLSAHLPIWSQIHTC